MDLKTAVCVRVRLGLIIFQIQGRSSRHFNPPEQPGTETDKIKGVTRDKNCGVDKYPLFSLASPDLLFSALLPTLLSVSFSVSRLPSSPHEGDPRVYLSSSPVVPPRFSTGEIRYRHFRVARISNDRSRSLQGCRKMWRRKLATGGATAGKGVETSPFFDTPSQPLSHPPLPPSPPPFCTNSFGFVDSFCRAKR